VMLGKVKVVVIGAEDEKMKVLVIGVVVEEEEAKELAIVARSKEFSFLCSDTIKQFKGRKIAQGICSLVFDDFLQ
jgi:hypothetical protein